MTLNRKEIWSGEYRGVRYEIIHWELGWNYYLLIPIDQLPEDKRHEFNLRAVRHESVGRVRYFYETHMVPDLNFHGGCTWYEKHRNEIGKVTGYRIGCDYMHHFDTEHYYNLDIVDRDARQSIDKLWERIPNLKIACNWDGKYYDTSEMVTNKNGHMVAKVNLEHYQ